jgi:hypothetical protein
MVVGGVQPQELIRQKVPETRGDGSCQPQELIRQNSLAVCKLYSLLAVRKLPQRQ